MSRFLARAGCTELVPIGPLVHAAVAGVEVAAVTVVPVVAVTVVHVVDDAPVECWWPQGGPRSGGSLDFGCCSS